MVMFRFFRDFDWDTVRENCVLCRAVTMAFKRNDGPDGVPIEVPAEAAEAAEAAGAGERVGVDDE